MIARNVRRRSGFSLIEVIIVVVILGILSALVTPQFTHASDSAYDVNVRSQLWRIRGQIDIYDLRNPNSVFDPAAHGWDQLVGENYLHTEPENPLQASTVISDEAAMGVGWAYLDLDGFGNELYAVDSAGEILIDPVTELPY